MKDSNNLSRGACADDVRQQNELTRLCAHVQWEWSVVYALCSATQSKMLSLTSVSCSVTQAWMLSLASALCFVTKP